MPVVDPWAPPPCAPAARSDWDAKLRPPARVPCAAPLAPRSGCAQNVFLTLLRATCASGAARDAISRATLADAARTPEPRAMALRPDCDAAGTAAPRVAVDVATAAPGSSALDARRERLACIVLKRSGACGTLSLSLASYSCGRPTRSRTHFSVL